MSDDDIKTTHRYLMNEWGINQPSEQGPKADKGDKGDQGETGPKGEKGDRGASVDDAATRSFVIDTVEQATSLESIFVAKLGKRTVAPDVGLVLKGWKAMKSDKRVV